MSLSDSDILELNELCNAVIDGTLSDAQKVRLSDWLSTSEDARHFYVRTTGLSASLFYYASELQSGDPDTRAIPLPPPTRFHPWRWMFGVAAIAAAIAMIVWVG